ncbi:MAG: hypothetical protein JOZ02_10900 [Acidobacteria bacterium]|nr:hypothetical protein [Acidobacteriota bacterium]
MSVTVFGIRHHGPGSARSVGAALRELKPDAVLVEGPPDADELLALAAHASMRPPVALLVYPPDEPKRGAFFPFAEFSPEWQAIRYALEMEVPVRFMDLPQAVQLALHEPTEESPDPKTETQPETLRQDPLRLVAEAAGYGDGELWWEQLVEERRDGRDLFAALLELMAALREETAKDTTSADRKEALREAHMRQTIRRAEREGFGRIAAVCGAWHAPALSPNISSEREDAALLKGLPRRKVAATWAPWTYGRLTYRSGYGSGVQSPGYYQYLWSAPANVTASWMARVAQLLRGEDMDASSASVIEAVRLAEALAALRGRPVPGLSELNDATRAVLCFGDDTPLRLVAEKLIVGETLGEVPEETPGSPLQQDLSRAQKRLRLRPEASERILDLDLRKPNDLERSRLLHRLRLLGVPWGLVERARGKGTFREVWRLRWVPELTVALIEAGTRGNTIRDAATAFALEQAARTQELPGLTALVEQTLLADLAEAVGGVVKRLQEVATLSGDIPHAMDALAPLASVLRYGSVRQTDTRLVRTVVDGLITRVAIGLPDACASLGDEAAEEMYPRLVAVNGAVVTLKDEGHQALWHSTLKGMADQRQLHGLIAGRCCRILFDQRLLTAEEASTKVGLALSHAGEPEQAARWVDGFLRGSGLVLLHSPALWEILDGWVASLKPDLFTRLLPLLRRTFSTFPAPERRQMGERARKGPAVHAQGSSAAQDDDVDVARADKVLPLCASLLGIELAG